MWNFYDSAIFDAERLRDRYDLDHYDLSTSRFRITVATLWVWICVKGVVLACPAVPPKGLPI